ncbi:hypothetical protein ACHAXS_013543, partial [Conticribra weissflogii]
RRERAIRLLTETEEERERRQAREKHAARKQFLENEIKRYMKHPETFDRNDSEIFGTKKGLSEEERNYDYKILKEREDE